MGVYYSLHTFLTNFNIFVSVMLIAECVLIYILCDCLKLKKKTLSNRRKPKTCG